MSLSFKFRKGIRDFGFRPDMAEEVEKWGVELTICQLVVVVLSIASIVFLLVPLYYLQELPFIILFLVLSLTSLSFGIWFWVHKAEICEHPEKVHD